MPAKPPLPVPRWIRTIGETVRWLESLAPPDAVQAPVMSFTFTLEDKPESAAPTLKKEKTK